MQEPSATLRWQCLDTKALSAVIRTGEHVGMQMLIDILRASGRAELLERGYDKLKTYGAGRDLSYKEWKEYIYQMIQLGYMEIDYAAERVLRMTPLGRRVLYGEQKAQLVIYREPDELTRPVRRGERKSSFKAQPIRPIRSASTDETLLDSSDSFASKSPSESIRRLISSSPTIPWKTWWRRNRSPWTSSATSGA